jgi:hypothetical protein
VRPSANHYREQAAHSRKLAGGVKEREAKGHILKVAEQYDKLAEEAAREGR